ncbi:MBL fold metallo-hydrolase [Nannocystaceae bacterium ST9]
MDWTSLGHAGWLIEAAGLRLLCDPLLAVDHHGGVFEVSPRRRLRAEALRPDFVLVSHRHPDHFDVGSLARLAALDPESVVITPDPLVAWTARELGFRSVRELPPGRLVELDGLRLVTSESASADEWGLMVASDEGVVWNQVDTVFRDRAHLRSVVSGGLAALGRSRIDLVLAQWQPMLEIAAQLGRAIGFPRRAYAELLGSLASIEPGAIVPSSAGTVHAERFDWLNHVVYPVDDDRFLADAARVCPRAQVLPSRLGGVYRLRAGEVALDPEAGASLIEPLAGGPRRDFRPLAIPAIHDTGSFLGAPEPVERMQADVARWLERELGPALIANFADFEVDRALRLVVEVVFVDRSWTRTLVVDGRTCELHEGADPGWDAWNAAAGSMLWEVLVGRRHWGDLLLSGGLRATTRAYRVDARGLHAANLGEAFCYYALSYAESVERAVRWELARVRA